MSCNHERSAQQVFDDWALDYHAAGMEEDHRPSVMEAFELIPDSDGLFLEIGVGNGYGLQWMAEHQFKNGRCHGIDVSSNMVSVARDRLGGADNVTIEQADFLQLHPQEADRPDVIFSMEVFYYLPDIAAGIRHAYELLRPGGLLMVLVNHFVERRDSHDWSSQLNTPMQLWTARQYHESFLNANFVDVRQRYVGIPSDEIARSANPGTLATWGSKPF